MKTLAEKHSWIRRRDAKGVEKIQEETVFGMKPENPKLRTDVIKGNRAIMDFEIVDGEPEVEIGEEVVEFEIEFWKAGLILFAVGKDMSMNAIYDQGSWLFLICSIMMKVFFSSSI